MEIVNSGDAGLLVTLSIGQARELIREEVAKALSLAPKEEKLLDAKQASEMLSTSPDWIYRHSKKLPFTRKLTPKMVRFSYAGIVKWLATSTTVSLTSIDHVAAWASIELSHDGASKYIAQRGDGIGHVTLSALGCRAECNLGVGKPLLIERSFF